MDKIRCSHEFGLIEHENGLYCRICHARWSNITAYFAAHGVAPGRNAKGEGRKVAGVATARAISESKWRNFQATVLGVIHDD